VVEAHARRHRRPAPAGWGRPAVALRATSHGPHRLFTGCGGTLKPMSAGDVQPTVASPHGFRPAARMSPALLLSA
jgi:hypothetical protein